MKYQLTLNDRTYEVVVELAEPMLKAEFDTYAPAPAATPAAPAQEAAPAAAPTAPVVAGEGTQVSSPMPGNILKVNVAAGQAVKEGDVLLILEAMKMENEIMAPCDGVIASVNTSKGSAVESGALLCVIQ